MYLSSCIRSGPHSRARVLMMDASACVDGARQLLASTIVHIRGAPSPRSVPWPVLYIHTPYLHHLLHIVCVYTRRYYLFEWTGTGTRIWIRQGSLRLQQSKVLVESLKKKRKIKFPLGNAIPGGT